MAQKSYLDYIGLEELVSKIKEKYAPIQAIQFKGIVATISALPTVSTQQVGYMYDVTIGGTTTADFLEGAGQVLRDGSNVVAVNIGTEEDPIMKWDIFPGVFDISDRLRFGTAMPASPETNETFLYLGDTTYEYIVVTPETGDNPKANGWYEYDAVNDTYILSDDEEVQGGTSYFEKIEQYVKGVIYVYSGSAWVAQTAGDTYIPITIAEIDALFED